MVASSTMQTKSVACHGMTSHAMWLKNFVCALGLLYSISRPLKIFYDNSFVVFFIKNNRTTTYSNYIKIKFLVVRKMVENGEILVKNIVTKNMFTIPLTKVLRPVMFIKYIENMGIVKSFDVLS